MKFKAKLSLQHTQLLFNLINPISRLHSNDNNSSSGIKSNESSTILYLDNDKLVISTRGSSNKNDAEGIFCFAELVTTDGIFNNHIIESIETDNAILMEICLGQLKTAFKGVLGTQKEGNALLSQELTLKLAKRNGGMPHLCLDVRDVNIGESGIGVYHAIPVKIMRVDELQHHVPPRLGMPDVQLALPRDRLLKPFVERLKGITPHVFIEGSMSGILTFRIDSDCTSIRTSFNKLTAIHQDCKSSQANEQNHFMEILDKQTELHSQTKRYKEAPRCTVKVDSRKLHASLHWQGTLRATDVNSAILCMWENEMLVLDVTMHPNIGRFMYYIPVNFVSPDEGL